MNYYARYNSIIGELYIIVDEKGLKRIELCKENFQAYLSKNKDIKENTLACNEIIKQLEEYFKGERKTFELSISLEGTEFRKKVWRALMKIPYGETRSYSDIAIDIENPNSVRAVGGANRSNPIPIIIPCHRVIGKNGSLTGYLGDKMEIKRRLLEIEGVRYQ
ncbi:methylated-DNA--[protein]-cysteine S-methyltransferase [Hathewaya histolytica]|uniref:Methylated-DNA--protein-cysteine methyltransferase n=1 Tax=Hathewaya histolytica TaxID=1498 RepID=A0A4U9RDC7_HATHI|nr:methylated-DNA--[protein]-cysteine S-methyltransferase [Hathewaya histolytica]VTQ89226.1 methylated-DNA--protein-cysteine methyltransferase [Hathewaya histolytica]